MIYQLQKSPYHISKYCVLLYERNMINEGKAKGFSHCLSLPTIWKEKILHSSSLRNQLCMLIFQRKLSLIKSKVYLEGKSLSTLSYIFIFNETKIIRHHTPLLKTLRDNFWWWSSIRKIKNKQIKKKWSQIANGIVAIRIFHEISISTVHEKPNLIIINNLL